MEFDIADLTDCGNRNINEDYIGYRRSENGCCIVVCDGLGGMGQGDAASACVAETILGYYDEKPEQFELDKAFTKAQEKLLALQREKNVMNQMQTTAVVLYIKDGIASFGHIGDTRLYMFDGIDYIRTLDHSIPQMLVQAGELDENEIRFHDDRNKLIKVIGNDWNTTTPYTITDNIELKEQLAFLLCTDGFWEHIEEPLMIKLLKKSKDATHWLKLMNKKIIKNGRKKDMDNYSAVAVQII